jgi:hypothetical protein
MPTRLALRFAVASLLSCALVHCTPPQGQPVAPAADVAPSGAVVGSPTPAMLAFLVKARAKP